MYKLAGHIKYAYGAISPSDPSKLALGYDTREQAQEHADRMNKSRLSFGEPGTLWNLNYWKTQPEPWIVFKVEEQ